MLAARGVVGLALLGLWLYCIIEVITTEESLVRHLPKTVWLLIVLFLPDIGSIVWLVAGRPEKASFRIGEPGYRAPRAPLGAEDRADFGVDLDNLSPIVRERRSGPSCTCERSSCGGGRRIWSAGSGRRS